MRNSDIFYSIQSLSLFEVLVATIKMISLATNGLQTTVWKWLPWLLTASLLWCWHGSHLSLLANQNLNFLLMFVEFFSWWSLAGSRANFPPEKPKIADNGFPIFPSGQNDRSLPSSLHAGLETGSHYYHFSYFMGGKLAEMWQDVHMVRQQGSKTCIQFFCLLLPSTPTLLHFLRDVSSVFLNSLHSPSPYCLAPLSLTPDRTFSQLEQSCWVWPDGFGTSQLWVQILVFPLTSCVTLRHLVHFSASQFCYLGKQVIISLHDC